MQTGFRLKEMTILEVIQEKIHDKRLLCQRFNTVVMHPKVFVQLIAEIDPFLNPVPLSEQIKNTQAKYRIETIFGLHIRLDTSYYEDSVEVVDA